MVLLIGQHPNIILHPRTVHYFNNASIGNVYLVIIIQIIRNTSICSIVAALICKIAMVTIITLTNSMQDQRKENEHFACLKSLYPSRHKTSF